MEWYKDKQYIDYIYKWTRNDDGSIKVLDKMVITENNPSLTLLNKWFQNDKNTPMVQVITAFIWGILLSPWSSGLIALFASILIFEILTYLFTKGDPRYYNVFVRTGVICSSILGFIIGRTLSCTNVCEPGID